MSQINVTNLSHESNGGDPNIILYADGTTSIKGIQGAAANPNLLDNSSFRINQRNLWTGHHSNGFLCDRWSCGNRVGWSIQRGIPSENPEGVAPFGAYCLKAGNVSVWETGVELQNMAEDQNSEYVTPIAYPGCQFVLSVWAHRPTNDIDQLKGTVAYRKQTNISDDHTVFFDDNLPRTTESLTIDGKTWWRYEQFIDITSYPTADQTVLYVGFTLSDEDLLACPKLERGNIYTPWVAEDLQTEEQRCQRYFWHWEGRLYVHGVQSNNSTDGVSKYATIQFPTGMAYSPLVKSYDANPGTMADISRWSAIYSELSGNNVANYVSGLEASAELTSFQTWSSNITS